MRSTQEQEIDAQDGETLFDLSTVLEPGVSGSRLRFLVPIGAGDGAAATVTSKAPAGQGPP